MAEMRTATTKSNEYIQSFEIVGGGKSGDLISKRLELGNLKVGLIATGYFEFFRMYPGLGDKVKANMDHIAEVLAPHCDLVYPGFIQTLDESNDAGVMMRKECVDVIIIAEGTYTTDYLVHQALLHIPESTPVLLFASQERSTINWDEGYAGACRNSGPMGVIQVSCGLQKMKRFLPYEVVVGCIDDPEVEADIVRWIKVRKTIRDLHFWNIGLIGHILRGMYDFQYDKTDIGGKLGPHIMDIDIKHLRKIFDTIDPKDDRVVAMVNEAKAEFEIIDGLTDADLLQAARLGVAMSELIETYKLDGLALLGQHFIEPEFKTTSYLGLANILKNDQAICVTEGDILGLIICKIMKDFSGGITPFFGEWEEIDTELNALCLLGHGFVDPRSTRKDRKVKLGMACEEWGWEGKAPGLEATFGPGAVTLCHIISHAGQWKMWITEGNIPDTKPLEVAESTCIVQVDKPVREFYRNAIKNGFAHHAIACPAHIGKELRMFAEQLGIEVVDL